MIQKVIKVGNSIAVTMPKDFIKGARIKAGDEVVVESSLDTLTVRPKSKGAFGLTPEFVKSVDDFIAEYRPALEELASK